MGQSGRGVSGLELAFGHAPAGGNDSWTTLLLHGEGTNGGTTFTDSSAAAHTVTAVGTAQTATDQFKFGASSAKFGGTNSHVTLDGSSGFAFGTADFTIDFWVRFATSLGTELLYDGRTSGGTELAPTLYILSGGSVFLRYSVNAVDKIVGTTALAIDTWYHVAVTRSGTSTKLFLNGTQEGLTYTDSNTYVNPAARPVVGGSGHDPTVNSMTGWIDEFRISKGIARWTANFTPPSVPYS